MEKICVINGNDVREVNRELENGWKIKMIVPFSENVSKSNEDNTWGQPVKGAYGAFVILEYKIN